MEVRIDKEFQELIPGLAQNELELLEASLLAEGCRDALVTWDGILLDGHHRHEICTRHGIEFETFEMQNIETRQDAMDWIDRNQLGRRNLTPDQMSLIRGRRYNRVKKTVGNPHDECAHNEPIRTAEKLAQEHGVSRETIKRDAKFASAVEQLGIESEVTAGNMPAPRKEIVQTARYLPEDATPEDIEEAVAKISRAHVSNNSGNNEWYTPSKFIEAARAVMGGIDLDPASCEVANGMVKAGTFYNQEDNGLEKGWFGKVWLNPPYSGTLVREYAEKVLSEVGNCEQIIVLVNNATETGWFQSLLTEARAVCLLEGRIKFLDENMNPKNTPLQGQAILYFGDDEGQFVEEFTALGQVLVHA